MPRLKYRKVFYTLVIGCGLLLLLHQYQLHSGSAEENRLGEATTNILRALGNRNTSALVLPDEKTVILQPLDKNCQNFGSNLFVLFVMISSPENRENRDAIRSGFGSSIEAMSKTMPADAQLKLLFFLGLPSDSLVMNDVKNEFALYEDMVVDDFVESYLNLTLKTLRMLKWTQENCYGAKYLAKIDDDVYLHLPQLIEYLQKVPEDEAGTLIAGHKYNRISIDKNPNSKWYTPTFLHPRQILPDFAAGFFYVLGTEAVPKIYNTSLKTPLFHLEDVFLTGFVASEALNMKIYDIANIFVFWAPIFNLYTTTCSFQTYFAVHSASLEYLRCWNDFNSPNFSCGYKPVYFYC